MRETIVGEDIKTIPVWACQVDLPLHEASYGRRRLP